MDLKSFLQGLFKQAPPGPTPEAPSAEEPPAAVRGPLVQSLDEVQAAPDEESEAVDGEIVPSLSSRQVLRLGSVFDVPEPGPELAAFLDAGLDKD